MAKTPYRAIPPAGKELTQLHATVDALHENVEIMQGLRGSRGGHNQTFIQQPGEPTPVGVRDGDLLMNKASGAWVTKVWLNGQWS